MSLFICKKTEEFGEADTSGREETPESDSTSVCCEPLFWKERGTEVSVSEST